MPPSFDPNAPVSTVEHLPPSVQGKVVDLRIFGRLTVAARALMDISRSDLATDTGIHHSNLAKMERGEFTDLSKCAKVQEYFEQAGVEFLAGTREIMLRYNPDTTGLAITIDPTLPRGVRFMHPRSLDLDELLSTLKDSGVHIEGEDMLRDVLTLAKDWCEALVHMAMTGRKSGVRFTRPATGGPSERGLMEQLSVFPFATHTALQMFVRNIIAVEQ